jgi:Fe-S cluster biogenesis protein NfuA
VAGTEVASANPADLAGTDPKVARVLMEVLAPLVEADGGLLYLVSASEEYVELHVGGRYSGCPGNTLVRRRVIEPALQRVAPALRVGLSAGPLVPKGATPLRADSADPNGPAAP